MAGTGTHKINGQSVFMLVMSRCPLPKSMKGDLWCNIAFLTHWGQGNMAVILQTTFSNAFPSIKMYKFRLRFYSNLFPRVQLTIFQHLFRKWLGAGQATSHYLNQWWLVYWRIYASQGLIELRVTAFRKCCDRLISISAVWFEMSHNVFSWMWLDSQ